MIDGKEIDALRMADGDSGTCGIVPERSVHVAVVDDEPMAREHVRTLLNRFRPDWTVEEAKNGHEALKLIEKGRVDLLLLDIQMPGMDGFNVLAECNPEDLPEVVFVTAYEEYAVKAFEAHALDYLIKPYDDGRFRECLERAESRILGSRAQEINRRSLLALMADLNGKAAYLTRIAVRNNDRTIFIPVAEVDYFKAEGCYIRMHTCHSSFLIRESLGRLESRLDPASFMRIHRSSMVRLDAVREIHHRSKDDMVMILNNGTGLPISRTYRKKVLSR